MQSMREDRGHRGNFCRYRMDLPRRVRGMSDSGADLLSPARKAAAERDWKTAYDLLADADASGLVADGDLPWVAQVAYAAGHFDATIEAWERAHAASMRRGD